MEPKTLQQAVLYYSDLDVCRKLLAESRWPEGPVCERCGSLHVKELATRKIFKCYDCKRQFSVKVGTIFEDSPLGLDKWFVCMWMIANCKNGVSSYEIHRALGVKQETAWFMLHRVRHAMQNGSFEKLSGAVESDSTYIGGAEKNRHNNKKKDLQGGSGKTIVFGVVERGGKARSQVVEGTNIQDTQNDVLTNVAIGSRLFTDEAPGYRNMHYIYDHATVNHSKGQYVSGETHTNTIENFWSLFKRGLKGTYVSVEPFHLNRYIDEQCFRYNNRKTDDGNRFRLVLSSVGGKRLTYDNLKTFG